MGLAEHLQAAAGAHASTASSLQTALAQATELTQTLAQDVQGSLQQLSERLGAASPALLLSCLVTHLSQPLARMCGLVGCCGACSGGRGCRAL